MIRRAVGGLLLRAGLKLLGLEKIAEEASREMEVDDSPEEGPRGPSKPPQRPDAGLGADELDDEAFTSLGPVGGPIVSEAGMRMRAGGESSTPQAPEPIPLPGSIEARMAEVRKKLRT